MKSLYRYVIDHLGSDLAICTGDKWVSDISLFKRADYKWIFNEPEDWYEYYKINFKGNLAKNSLQWEKILGFTTLEIFILLSKI